MGKCADPDRAAADRVFIGRTEAAPGGADLALSARILTQRIEVAMEGEDERAIIGYLQGFRGDGYALGGELLDFGLERPGIEHHAIADDRQGAANDPGRQQRPPVGLVADNQSMTVAMPALEAGDDIGPARHAGVDLALSLVPPHPPN